MTNQLNTLRKTKEENQNILTNNFNNNNEINSDLNLAHTGLSFTKQPHFNSMAFQSGNSFGGINLEDIASPDCFIIEQELKNRLKVQLTRAQ